MIKIQYSNLLNQYFYYVYVRGEMVGYFWEYGYAVCKLIESGFREEEIFQSFINN